MLFIEAKTDRTAGHEWRETGKNLKCILCGCELKYYMKLEKLKVSMALRCTGGVRVVVSGSGMHPNLHCTHTMTLERERKYLCQLCRGQYTSGGSLMGLAFCLRWQVEFETETALQGQRWVTLPLCFVYQKKSRDDGPMTVMLALSTIGCRLQTFAGCSEIEIGCAHGRKKGRGFERFHL